MAHKTRMGARRQEAA